jgi:hypothetical protein
VTFDPRWWEKSPDLLANFSEWDDVVLGEAQTQGGHFARVILLDDGGFLGGCVCEWFGQHRADLTEASIDVKLHLLESV